MSPLIIRLQFNRHWLKQPPEIRPQNNTDIIINRPPILDKHAISMSSFSINDFHQPQSLQPTIVSHTLSLTQQSVNNNNFRLSTQIPYDNQHLIAIAQPNFSQNVLFLLHFPFISTGVPLQNHTTLLALKRFLCGYEACHLSTTKVRSPQFSHKFSLWTTMLHTVLLLYQQLQPTTVKCPCCPTLKHVRHHSTKSSRLISQPHKKLMCALYQFYCHSCTLPIVQHLSAVVIKEASSLLFIARQPTNQLNTEA